MQISIKLLGIIFLLIIGKPLVFAYDTYMSPEIYRAYGKQQIVTKDAKGNTQIITPNFKDYTERNNYLSEKYVCIYSPKSPAYGYRYVLYTPRGKYVGHSRNMQPSLNGYGYDPIPCNEGTPHFQAIEDAKKFYYPNLFE